MFEYILGFIALLKLYTGIRIFLIRNRNERYPLISGAEPFFYKKGKIGVLLIHGFTSTPNELRGLGKFLVKKNLTVSAPLLKGHGTNPNDLIKIKPIEWQNQIKNEINKLRKTCSHIYLVGSSFGGNLALDYAIKNKVDGIATVGVPILWKRPTIYNLLSYLRHIKLFQKKIYDSKTLKRKIIQRKIHYLNVPLITFGYILKFVKKTKKELNKINSPILILQSKTDGVVSRETPSYICNNISSKIKNTVWFEDGYHVIIDDDKINQKSYKEIYNFIHTSKHKI